MAYYNCLMIDLDDTLLDFGMAEEQALEKTFQQFEFPYTPENIEFYKTMNGQLWKELEQGKLRRETLYTLRWKKMLAHLGRLGSPAKIVKTLTEEEQKE